MESTESNPITPIAVTNWRDIRKMFGIKEKNRRGHMYIIGKTGSGKSTLIANMVVSDLQQGNGLALVDPHGDLVESVLHFVPQERIQDVVYFNVTDFDYPVAFNPLEEARPKQHHLIVSGLISVFKKIWPEFWGPRLEHILRHSLLTLLELSGCTLFELIRLLTDKTFRTKVVSTLADGPIKDFWAREFEKYSARLQSEAVSPILNKVGQFLTSLPLRNVLGQTKSTINIREIMDTGKIFLVNLSKGRIGEDSCALLGAMIVTQIQLAALGRADVNESDRRPFYLYVDEVHNFLTKSFADVLSESRKFGLSLTLTHQFSAQLHEDIRAAVLGNVGTIITFRLGSEDAGILADEFSPVVQPDDFINLPNHHIYVKLMIDGMTSRPFSAITLPLPEITASYAEEIIATSRAKYARPRAEAEQDRNSLYKFDSIPETEQPTLQI